MAARKQGEGEVFHLTLEVLRGIREELSGFRQEMRSEVGGLREEVGGLREEVGGLREEVGGLRDDVRDVREDLRTLEDATIRGFTGVRRAIDEVNARLDNLRDVAGAGWREHEGRISSLERRVGDLESRGR